MSSVNKVILIGNLGRDPEIRYTQAGDAVVNLSIATVEKWKDKATGSMKESTDWHRVGIFGRPAEVAAQYLKKGSQIFVEGKIKYKKYTDKLGHEKVVAEILSDNFKMLGKPTTERSQSMPKNEPDEIQDDEIPF